MLGKRGISSPYYETTWKFLEVHGVNMEMISENTSWVSTEILKPGISQPEAEKFV